MITHLTFFALTTLWLAAMALLLPRALGLHARAQARSKPAPQGPARSVLWPHLPEGHQAGAFAQL